MTFEKAADTFERVYSKPGDTFGWRDQILEALRIAAIVQSPTMEQREVLRREPDTPSIVTAAILIYLRYAPPQKVSRTVTLAEDGSFEIDLDADGNVLGIELIGAQNADFEKLVQVAKERDLSLEGIFSYA